jgi:hypothetical protein
LIRLSPGWQGFLEHVGERKRVDCAAGRWIDRVDRRGGSLPIRSFGDRRQLHPLHRNASTSEDLNGDLAGLAKNSEIEENLGQEIASSVV